MSLHFKQDCTSVTDLGWFRGPSTQGEWGTQRSDSNCFFIIAYWWLFIRFIFRVAVGCFSPPPPKHFYVTHKSFLFWFALIATDHELLVVFLLANLWCVAVLVLWPLLSSTGAKKGSTYTFFLGDIQGSTSFVLGSLIEVALNSLTCRPSQGSLLHTP